VIISLWIYIALVIVAGAMAAYMVIDRDNRVYANIVAGLVAAIIFLYVASISVSGTVGTYDVVVNSTTDTGAGYIYTYTTVWEPFTNATLLWIFALCGVLTGGYAVILVAEALIERKIQLDVEP